MLVPEKSSAVIYLFIIISQEQNWAKYFLLWRNVYKNPNVTKSLITASVSIFYIPIYIYLLYIYFHICMYVYIMVYR